MTTTSGNCAWMVYEPSPVPSDPGRLSELRPCHSHPGIAVRHATISAPASMRLTACPRVAPVRAGEAPSGLGVPGWSRWALPPAADPRSPLLPPVVLSGCSAPQEHPAASAAATPD